MNERNRRQERIFTLKALATLSPGLKRSDYPGNKVRTEAKYAEGVGQRLRRNESNFDVNLRVETLG
jgi:hypothetical protein